MNFPGCIAPVFVMFFPERLRVESGDETADS